MTGTRGILQGMRAVLAGPALVLTALAWSSGEAGATLIQVNSRASLNANDLVNWSVLGPNGTDVSNPVTLNSTGGLSTTVSKSSISGPFQVLVQGQGWGGNFSPGETILWTKSFGDGSPRPITLQFDSPVLGLGMNIQQANALATFTAAMAAFDSTGTYLGEFSVTGASNSNGDGSAVFLGLKSDTANIKQVVVYLSAAPFNYIDSYGINQVSLLTPAVAPPTGNSVPEPGTLISAVLAAVATVAWRRRR